MNVDGLYLVEDRRLALTVRKTSRLSLSSGVILSLPIRPRSVVIMPSTRALIVQMCRVTISSAAGLDVGLWMGWSGVECQWAVVVVLRCSGLNEIACLYGL